MDSASSHVGAFKRIILVTDIMLNGQKLQGAIQESWASPFVKSRSQATDTSEVSFPLAFGSGQQHDDLYKSRTLLLPSSMNVSPILTENFHLRRYSP